jgi:hypothetical protein
MQCATPLRKLPGERNFGLLFALIFSVLGAYYYWKAAILLAALASTLFGIAFLAVALLKPDLLHPLNRAWCWLGFALGKVVNPLVLGAIFFLLLTPIAALMRAFGRDALHLRAGPKSEASYWVERDTPGPDPATFKNQF